MVLEDMPHALGYFNLYGKNRRKCEVEHFLDVAASGVNWPFNRTNEAWRNSFCAGRLSFATMGTVRFAESQNLSAGSLRKRARAFPA
jgi:hypothetical protein